MGADEWVRDVDTDLGNIIRHINRGPHFAQVTTAQRDLLTNLWGGRIIFNTTTQKLNVYNGSSWEQITSA